MDVASVGLCQELYTLSRWDAVGMGWYDVGALSAGRKSPVLLPDQYRERESIVRLCPAYEVGFLLRKLEDIESGYGMSLVFSNGTESGSMRWVAQHRDCFGEGDSPADSVARLMVQLLRRYGGAAAA